MLTLSFIHNSLRNSFAENSEGKGSDIRHDLYCAFKLKCKVFNCVKIFWNHTAAFFFFFFTATPLE